METLVRQITIGLTLFLGSVYCESLSLNNQYGPPSNFLGGGGGSGNNHHGGPPQGGGGGGGNVINSYGAPLADGHNPDQDYVDGQPKSYEFGYAVKDTATGNDFGRSETSDGETVRGEYRVQLPDGRTQIVTYTADWRTGFHADVRYEGEATFPDQYVNNNNNNNNNNNDNGYNNNANNNYYNNNGGYNNNNNNLGYNNNGGYNNNQGYNNYNRGNQGGYNYNSNSNGNYNNNNNNNNGANNYQYPGSNSIDNYNGGGYTGSMGGSFGPSGPSASYGTPNFH